MVSEFTLSLLIPLSRIILFFHSRLNAKGGKTLSLLHEKCVTQSLASTDKLRELGLSLTRSAAEGYFEVSSITYIF